VYVLQNSAALSISSAGSTDQISYSPIQKAIFLFGRAALWALLLFTDSRLLVEGRHFAASMSTPPPRLHVHEP
jgi:hypothetical protein